MTLEQMGALRDQVVALAKAKRRSEGEEWTQPSGRRVKKVGGKIVPVKEGGERGGRKKRAPREDPVSPTRSSMSDASLRGAYAQQGPAGVKALIAEKGLPKSTLREVEDRIVEAQGRILRSYSAHLLPQAIAELPTHVRALLKKRGVLDGLE